jgi:hypothetical protein
MKGLKEPIDFFGGNMNLIKITLVATLLSCHAYAETLSYGEVRDLGKKILSKGDYGLADSEPDDIKSFCPKYKSLSDEGRRTFWAHLVTNIARYESSFSTSTTFTENNGNTSRGLLQISYGSIDDNYKDNGCDVITSASSLMEANKNLQCGFAIISYWVEKDGNLASGNESGASRYWSTLRKPYKVTLKKTGKTVTVGKKDLIINHIKDNYSECF